MCKPNLVFRLSLGQAEQLSLWGQNLIRSSWDMIKLRYARLSCGWLWVLTVLVNCIWKIRTLFYTFCFRLFLCQSRTEPSVIHYDAQAMMCWENRWWVFCTPFEKSKEALRNPLQLECIVDCRAINHTKPEVVRCEKLNIFTTNSEFSVKISDND